LAEDPLTLASSLAVARGPLEPAAWAPTAGMGLLKALAFGALMLFVGTKLAAWLFEQVARTGSRGLFTLAVLAPALGTAFASHAASGLSLALGAFVAGLVVSHHAGRRIAAFSGRLCGALLVWVGMVFEPAVFATGARAGGGPAGPGCSRQALSGWPSATPYERPSPSGRPGARSTSFRSSLGHPWGSFPTGSLICSPQRPFWRWALTLFSFGRPTWWGGGPQPGGNCRAVRQTAPSGSCGATPSSAVTGGWGGSLPKPDRVGASPSWLSSRTGD